MILEAYIPTELLKILEKKGFDYKISNEFGVMILDPTINKALTWLREEKKINITIQCYKDQDPRFSGWYYIICDMSKDDWRYAFQDYCKDNSTSTWNSAAIDAIEYCLYKLI